jgi:hypothetical protein
MLTRSASQRLRAAAGAGAGSTGGIHRENKNRDNHLKLPCCADTPPAMATIPSNAFYSNYHGHLVAHLDIALQRLQELKGNAGIIYLAGDSSLDNKFWIRSTTRSTNGYEHILKPPASINDITHSLNKEIVARNLQDEYAVINAAVEESTLGDRACMSLLPQDKFISSHITSNDSIVVSVGGNDIALRPSCCTVVNTCCLLYCSNEKCIDKCACGRPLPCDDYCCGMCCGCASNLCAWPCGYGYFLHLFGSRIQSYVRQLANRRKPRKVLICMIYYLDVTPGGSWADTALSLLGYNTNPGHLQTLIRKVYEQATRTISIPDVEVVAVPFFIAMDGTDRNDYEQRAEPSAQGGGKLANLILDAVIGGNDAMSTAYDDWKRIRTMER